MDPKVPSGLLANMSGADISTLLTPRSKAELKTALDVLLMSVADDCGNSFNNSIG
jgi:hypothetical protein